MVRPLSPIGACSTPIPDVEPCSARRMLALSRHGCSLQFHVDSPIAGNLKCGFIIIGNVSEALSQPEADRLKQNRPDNGCAERRREWSLVKGPHREGNF